MLLLLKIVVTVFLVVLPLLFLPKAKLERMLNISASSHFIRLYGLSVLPLLITCASGIPVAESGVVLWWVVGMGLVSNSGSAFMLFFVGGNTRSRLAGYIFGLVALGLVSTVISPELVLR